MLPKPSELILWIENHPGRRTRQLATDLGVGAPDFDDFTSLCLELQRAGQIIRVPHGGWDLPSRTPFRVGTLQVTRGGKGFVRVSPDSVHEEDFFVRPENTGTGFSGDLVLMRMEGGGKEKAREPRGGRGRSEHRSSSRRRPGVLLREGAVVDVLERGRRLVRGRFLSTRDGGVVTSMGGRHSIEIHVPEDEVGAARSGDEVVVRLLPGTAEHARPRGKVLVRSIDEGPLEADLHVICELFGLHAQPAPAALREAEALGEMRDGMAWPDRTDLRSERIFTVDPVDAKDFDDAISLKHLGAGHLQLDVHIADVSHYVRPGSALDREAERRGTSVYLPGRVIPMLPEKLSNGLASLRPGEDRLTKTVRMHFDASGEMESFDVFRSVIRSVRRFTYEEVLSILEWIDTGKEAHALPPDHAEYEPVLRDMARLRDRLSRRRRRRGALSLDIPKLRLTLGEGGEVVGIGCDARDASHSMIEEFMLAANEAVAAYCVERNLPLLSRVHAPPEERRLEDFRIFLHAVGVRVGPMADSHHLQHLVDRLAGDPLSGVIQLALLRTMEHAAYFAGPGGHFALATDRYCHFTSPIRRYPDTIVHQILDEHLDGRLGKAGRRREWADRLPGLAETTSALERRAEEAEREMSRLRLIRYLKPLVGEHMSGRIVSVHPFGFFVRIEATLIEGMVPVATLTDDYYEFDEKRLLLHGTRGRHRYAIGDGVDVELFSVDADAREITFRVLRVHPRKKDADAEPASRGKATKGDGRRDDRTLEEGRSRGRRGRRPSRRR